MKSNHLFPVTVSIFFLFCLPKVLTSVLQSCFNVFALSAF